MLTITQLLLHFYIYAFLGWCAEVAFAALKTGRFVNRGFLNGPLCPIYGFGILGCVYLLAPTAGVLPLLFFCAMALTTSLELVTGVILHRLFHTTWWDYSDEKYNFKGYICLRFAILWGFAATFVLKLIVPGIDHMVEALPSVVALILSAMLDVIFITDLVFTILQVRHLILCVEQMPKVVLELHHVSDQLGERIAETTLSVKEGKEEVEADFEPLVTMIREHRSMERAIGEIHRKEEVELFYEIQKMRLERISKAQPKRLHRVGNKRLLQAFPKLLADGRERLIDLGMGQSPEKSKEKHSQR